MQNPLTLSNVCFAKMIILTSGAERDGGGKEWNKRVLGKWLGGCAGVKA